MSNIEPATNDEVFTFLSMHTVEEKAQTLFLELDPTLQKLVINKGSMLEARDQNAVLISRIGQVSKLASGEMDQSGMRQGDWVCPGCMDHQFAKNLVCRQCGTPKPAGGGCGGGGWGGGGGQALPAAVLEQRASPEETEMFLSMYAVEPHAADKLRALDPCLQKMVINKGGLEEARDPTAMLMGSLQSAYACEDWRLVRPKPDEAGRLDLPELRGSPVLQERKLPTVRYSKEHGDTGANPRWLRRRQRQRWWWRRFQRPKCQHDADSAGGWGGCCPTSHA